MPAQTITKTLAPAFPDIGKIEYQGPETDNHLAYRYYNKDQIVLGKRMEDHLRMAVCYWHTFCWDGADIFGGGTFSRPWHNPSGSENNRMIPRDVGKLSYDR